MLKITVPEQELFDESKNEFITLKQTTLSLEHSLVSISKWESIYFKPFIGNSASEEKTTEEIIKYIECMTITQNVDPRLFAHMPKSVYEQIKNYISSPLSATTFSKVEGRAPGMEIITSELVYYWMTAFNIPFECEKWPIQRLLNLIRICSIKNNPKGQKMMSPREVANRNSALNAARRKKANSRG